MHEHRRRQLEARLLGGPDRQDQALVFYDTSGRSLYPKYQTAVFQEALTRAALPSIRFHDLRLPAATLLLARGVHPKVVSETLGQATITLAFET